MQVDAPAVVPHPPSASNQNPAVLVDKPVSCFSRFVPMLGMIINREVEVQSVSADEGFLERWGFSPARYRILCPMTINFPLQWVREA